MHGAFTDVTSSSGIDFLHDADARGQYRLPEEMGPGGALFDCDGDGDLDVFLAQGGVIEPEPGTRADGRCRLYRNDGDLHFTDITASSGAGVPGPCMGAAAADYDDDGDIDLLVTRLGPNVLLAGDGKGAFTDVTAAAGLAGDGFSASAAFLDFDRDGRLDLFVVDYVDWSPEREKPCYDPRGVRDYCNPMEYGAPALDHLYRNTGGGRLEDVTTAAGIAAARGNGLGIAMADLDGDGWIDLYVANDQTPAFLWMNQRDGTFAEEAMVRGAAFSRDGIAVAGMGAAAADLDGDLDLDLIVTNIHDQPHLAFENDGGILTDSSRAWGLAGWGVPLTAFGFALLDLECDGALDLFVCNGAVNRLADPCEQDNPYAEPDQLARWTPAGAFADASATALAGLDVCAMSRAALAGDLDGDGDIDLIVTRNRGRAQVLRNDAERKGRWASLELRTAGGVRHAIGARALVTAAGRTRLHQLAPQSGYLSSHDPCLHLGLGDAPRIDAVEVIWPDGTRERWGELPAGAVVVLVQGGAPDFTMRVTAR